MILIRLDAQNKVINQGSPALSAEAIIDGGWIDVTNHPDGPNFMGRTQLPNGSFTPFIPTPPTKREALMLKPSGQWNIKDIADWLKNQ